MKNGLLFVLLMAVMVAMAMPAGAVAPTIQQLPAVVIGDAGDIIDAATDTVLFRYVNVTDLNAITNEPNSGDSSKLKFWYETTGAFLKVTNTTAAKAALTAGEVTALKAASPTMPPAAKEITGGTDFWMSLIQDLQGNVTGSAAAATVAANGSPWTSATQTNIAGVKTMTLYAIDDVLTSKSVGQMTFDVYTIKDSADKFSPERTPVYGGPLGNGDFEGNTDGWTFLGTAPTGFVAGTQAASATGLGINGGAFTPSATVMGRFASWASPLQVVPVNAMNGFYLLGTLQLSGNAASASAAPGYRFLYLSTAYAHLGGIQATSPASGSSTVFVVPYTGNTRTMNIAWAVPLDLVEYGDAGILNKGVADPANDLRTYALQFDLFQQDATDAGAVFLDDVLVEKAPRPATTAALKEWGGSGIPFNTPSTGWIVSPAAPTGFDVATAAVGAANMTLALPGTSVNAFRSLTIASAAGMPSQTAGKLLRSTYVVSSSNTAQTPSVRFLSVGTTVGGLGPVFWGDQLNYVVIRGYVAPAQSAAGLPGSYKAAPGSTVEFYAPGEYAGTGAEEAFMSPQVDIIETGGTYPLNGWARPAATVTVSSAKLELVNP